MKITQLIIMEGYELTILERDSHSDGYPVYPGVLICPVCTQIWCRLIIPNGGKYTEIRPVICEKCGPHNLDLLHPDMRPVYGSLIANLTTNGYDKPMLDALPPDLLIREFNLTLDSYEALWQTQLNQMKQTNQLAYHSSPELTYY